MHRCPSSLRWVLRATSRQRPWLLAVLVFAPISVLAQPPASHCPGSNTFEMRGCVNQSWEQSDAQLRQKVSKSLMKQWREATGALCAAAYTSYKDGTIYPQLVVGCDDHLNRALLKEFRGLGE